MQINNISKYQNEVYGTSKHYKSDVEFKVRIFFFNLSEVVDVEELA